MDLKAEHVCESLCNHCAQLRPAKLKQVELDFWNTGKPELMDVYDCVVCEETILIKSAYAKKEKDN